jgi:hypothetical protein
VRGADQDDDRQAVRELLAELVAMYPAIQDRPGYDPDLLARLYLLRDIAAATDQLGTARVTVADWIGRAATLVRDEQDHDQALRLLHHAEARLAEAAVAH